ncbi:hypothetical protein SI65_02410 [Aspergillus cristatus]|uniref:Uncharacterized protein n=1 Tax=Aspergillus cristatus TaxID=573508 RepID=A0A1E3BME6_ASPCR|nr:hypothetical protein SI65_02410 [Aspergillus cristatus]
MSFDLGRTGGDKKGGEVTINEREWRANHILVGGGDAAYWHKASAESTYDWAGEGKDDMATIKRKATQYGKDHTTYNLITNNCLTFANGLYKQIH